ncbi:hypothetical protein BDQ17DRAFT_1387605 [Cyathus striatus]|nr:hypothetical protein BDQ17DRAFT_1387605 [Cyathus striatus]
MPDGNSRPRQNNSDSDDGSLDSPIESALDSSAALILVHDDSDNNLSFDFSDDEDDVDDDIRKASIPPLPPSLVFLYLLTPYLKLGAMFMPYTELPLQYGLPALLGFAAMSAFARQLWYLLARYLRKADMEEVICDTFAKGRGKEKRRELLRSLVRGGTGSISVLLATTYLRQSVRNLLPLVPQDLQFPFSSTILTLLLSLFVLILYSCKSLASKRIVYATWLSILTYLAWLGCVSAAHAKGSLEVHGSGLLRLGTFWQGLTTTAFAFTSSSTLPLYASLKGTTQPIITTTKTPRSRSFTLLSLGSVVTGTILMLPSVLFAALPNNAQTSSPSTVILQDIPDAQLNTAIVILNCITLVLGIPAIMVTTPAIPIPDRIRRSINFSLSKTLIFMLVVVLAFIPVQTTSILNDVLLVLVLASTYFVPAVTHIAVHWFRRPISIVIPNVPGTPSASQGTPNSTTPSPRAVHDELLQRKERALQKRQFRRRIVWDIGAWVLAGISATGVVGAAGRVTGHW